MKRDGWLVLLSFLIIPGAGMELYDSINKLLAESALVSPWDYTKYFFLTIAATAAVIEMRNRLLVVLDTSVLGPFAVWSMFVIIIGSIIVLARGLFGYGWGGYNIILIAFAVLFVVAWLAIGTTAQEEEEEKEREAEIEKRGGTEAVEADRAERSAVAKGMREVARDRASPERRWPH